MRDVAVLAGVSLKTVSRVINAEPGVAAATAERVEAAIAEHETLVAELERRLAEDWSDADTLAAHRRARDELQSLLAEWETLFERAQTRT
jgi:DNA-binding LacI/PurR family transcriptional regulator